MSKFNAKDYNFVAKRIRENFPTLEPSESDSETFKFGITMVQGGLMELAVSFARKYKEDNELFDPRMFLDSCSPDPEKWKLSLLWRED